MNTLTYNKIGDNGISPPPMSGGYLFVHFNANSDGLTIPKTIVVDTDNNPITEVNNNIKICKRDSKRIYQFDDLTDESITTEFTLAIPTGYSQRIGIDLSVINGYEPYIDSIIGSFSNNVYKCKFTNPVLNEDSDGNTYTDIPDISLKKFNVINSKNLTDCKYMFAGCVDLTAISYLDTSMVTDMESMFYGCNCLESIPLLDTSNVTNMKLMFNYCESLKTIPLLDTSNVTNMSFMFEGCMFTEPIPLLDTSNVTDMSFMFCDSQITTIPLFNTSKVTNMSNMFTLCQCLESIPLLDTSNVTDMSDMFSTCVSLTSIPQLSTGKVINMYGMFSGCELLTSIPQLDTSKVVNMSYMLSGTDITTIPELNLSSAEDISSMFEFCASLTSVSDLNSPNATNCDNMFGYCTSLESAHITIPKASITEQMFINCKNLTNVAIEGTPLLINARGMFMNCTSLNSVDGLNLSEIERAEYMFKNSGITAIPSLGDIQAVNPKFTRSSPTINRANTIMGMFADCKNLVEITIPYSLFAIAGDDCDIITSSLYDDNIDDMFSVSNAGLFAGCTNLETVNISTSNTYGITPKISLPFAFIGCTNLQRVKIIDPITNLYLPGTFYECSNLTRIMDSASTSVDIYSLIGAFAKTQIQMANGLIPWVFKSRSTSDLPKGYIKTFNCCYGVKFGNIDLDIDLADATDLADFEKDPTTNSDFNRILTMIKNTIIPFQDSI